MIIRDRADGTGDGGRGAYTSHHKTKAATGGTASTPGQGKVRLRSGHFPDPLDITHPQPQP